MHQSEEISAPEPTFSRALAEEALLIAARLQYEQRELLTLSELKRTAAEVDISPEFLERALELVGNEKPIDMVAPVKPKATVQKPVKAKPRHYTDYGIFPTVVLLQILILAGLSTVFFAGPFLVGLFVLALAGGCLFPSRRRAAEFAATSIVGWMLLIICESNFMRMDDAAQIFRYGPIALAIQFTAFLCGQSIASIERRSRERALEQEAISQPVRSIHD